MPYVRSSDRPLIHITPSPNLVGPLTYVLTDICARYLAAFPLSYSRWGDVVTALESTKLELYRRLIAPYEDSKRYEHGDVEGIVEVLKQRNQV